MDQKQLFIILLQSLLDIRRGESRFKIGSSYLSGRVFSAPFLTADCGGPCGGN